MDKKVTLLTKYVLFSSYKKIETEFETFREAKKVYQKPTARDIKKNR